MKTCRPQKLILPLRKTFVRNWLKLTGFIFIGMIFLTSPNTFASPWTLWQDYSGRRSYQQKNYTKAQKNFENVIQSDPKAEDFYNLGAVKYRQGKFEEARQNFTAALTAEDPVLKEKAQYNLGNSLYRLNRLQDAVKAYEGALKIEPQDKAAQLNLAFVKKKLETPPPPKESQQPKQGSGEGKKQGAGQKGDKKETPNQNQEGKTETKGDRQEKKQNQGASKENQEEGKKNSQASPSPQEKGEAPPKGLPSTERKNSQEKSENQPKPQEPPPSPSGTQSQKEKSASANQDESGEKSQGGKAQEKKGGQGNFQRAESQEPKDLSGKLKANGSEPPGKTNEQHQGLAPADTSPDAQEAERWLEMIEDHSEEVRVQQIQRAMGGSRAPEKDW